MTSDAKAREFEITKHISLREWFPLRLLELLTTGRTQLDIPEALFDIDYPGHILRRLKAIALSISCTADIGLIAKWRLGLKRSCLRVKATALNGLWYPVNPAEPDTERFEMCSARSAIVTSGIQEDTGTFTSGHPRGPLPFEGAGAIARYTVQIIGAARHWVDFDTVTDVVLTLRFSARQGADTAMVSPATLDWLRNHSVRMLSLRQEFPSEWARFKEAGDPSGETNVLRFAVQESVALYGLLVPLGKARQLHLFGRTKGREVGVEFIRGMAVVATATLRDGESVALRPQGGFEPHGTFVLRLNTSDIDDLWIVVDWASPVA